MTIAPETAHPDDQTCEPTDIRRRRQVIYWRLLAASFGLQSDVPQFERMTHAISAELGLPDLLLDPSLGIDSLLQRYPELVPLFDDFGLHSETDPNSPGEPSPEVQSPAPHSQQASESSTPELAENNQQTGGVSNTDRSSKTLEHALVLSKLLLNLFGTHVSQGVVSASQYAQWNRDVQQFERVFGYPPGGLRGRSTAPSGPSSGGTHGPNTSMPRPTQKPSSSSNAKGTSTTPTPTDNGQEMQMPAQSTEGDMMPSFETDLREALKAMEADLVKRMALREVLKDSQLASKLNPSIELVEQLLRDKSNLSGEALFNAKALIQRYIDEVAEVLKLQVMQAATTKIDRSVPPKRVFRNLDLKRTIWKNLTHWDPESQRLYVDRLYYRHSAKKTLPKRLIVVVDQSGSMVEAMVQCTILASIFAGLPHVDARLLAFDTRTIDLSPWVHDPFEVLLRTQLGGGTYILKALHQASELIDEPKNSCLVLISDFYEGGSDQELLNFIKSLKDSGVHFIPVGAVTSSGYYSVSQWFRVRLKELGTPILSGNVKKLIQELKAFL